MIRPVGNGVICWRHDLSIIGDDSHSRQSIRPYLTGRASGWHVPGISCQATIIWSLRDKHSCVLMLTRIPRLRDACYLGSVLTGLIRMLFEGDHAEWGQIDAN
jgi:hypothetical protein